MPWTNHLRPAADYSFPETASDACDEHSRTRPEADRGNMSAEGLPIDSAVAKHLSLSLLESIPMSTLVINAYDDRYGTYDKVREAIARLLWPSDRP